MGFSRASKVNSITHDNAVSPDIPSSVGNGQGNSSSVVNDVDVVCGICGKGNDKNVDAVDDDVV